MPVTISYQVQADAAVARDQFITGLAMASWLPFNTEPDLTEIWETDAAGDLISTKNNACLSGRYSPTHLHYGNYSFTAYVTPSDADDDTFGVHFRYASEDEFYYIAWDNGGGIRDATLSLRKRGTIAPLESLVDKKWTAGQRYALKVEVQGSRIRFWLDGELIFDHTDSQAPFLTGAYGPLVYSQPYTRFHGIDGFEVQEFSVQRALIGSIDESSTSNLYPSKVSPDTISVLLAPAIADYCTANGFNAGRVEVARYTVATTETNRRVYFDSTRMTTQTTDPQSYVWGHIVSQGYVPAAPTGLTGTLQSNRTSVLWQWHDASLNEAGFRAIDENGVVVAEIAANQSAWLETNLVHGALICRRMVAFNAEGLSEPSNQACVLVPGALPAPPSNMYGVPISESEIAWYWTDQSFNENGFRVYSDTGVLLVSLPAGTTSWVESGLQALTLYTRRVVGYNIAGESAYGEASATTLAPPPPERHPPEPPFDLSGTPVSDTAIEWKWTISGACYGFRLYDEAGVELAVLTGTARSFLETDLFPATTYWRRLTAFNADGESAMSDLASATTLDEQVVGGGGEEEPPVCEPLDRLQFGERMSAFQSGVGDGEDLIVRRPVEGTVAEAFRYEAYLQAETSNEITIYPQVTCDFQFEAAGQEEVAVYSGTFAGELTAYPGWDYAAKVTAEANVPFPYEWWLKYSFDEGHYRIDQFQWQGQVVAHGTGAAQSVPLDVTDATRWSRTGTDSAWAWDSAVLTYSAKDSTPAFAYRIDPAVPADYILRAELCTGSDDQGALGLCFRAVDPDNYYVLRWPGGQLPMELVRRKNGLDTTIATAAQVMDRTKDTWTTIEVQVVGQQFTVYAGDGAARVEVLTQADPVQGWAGGTYGPWCYAQADSRWRALTAAEVTAVQIDSPPADAQVEAGKTVAITPGTLAEYMAPYVADAGSTVDPSLPMTYLALTDSTTVTLTASPDGSSPVTAVTSLDKAPQWTSGVLESDRFAATITEDHGSTNPVVLAASADALMADAIDQYKRDHKLNSQTFIITNREAVCSYQPQQAGDPTELVHVAIDSDVVKASTVAATHYFDETGVVAGLIHGYEGEQAVTFPAWPVPVNKIDAVVPDGTTVTYRIVRSDANAGAVAVVWEDLGTAVDRTSTAPIVAWVKQGQDFLMVPFTREIADGQPPLLAVDPLLEAARDPGWNPNWANLHWAVTKKAGSSENLAALWPSMPHIIADDVGDAVLTRVTELLEVKATARYVVRPFPGPLESEVYTVTINGNGPFVRDGDGRLSARASLPPIPGTDRLRDVSYSLKILNITPAPDPDNPTWSITAMWDFSTTGSTTDPNDVVTLSANLTAQTAHTSYWLGPTVKGGPLKVDHPLEGLRFQEQLPRPVIDAASVQGSAPVQYQVVVTSSNPNVAITPDLTLSLPDTDTAVVPVGMKAEVENPIQGQWHPLVHNGYYYLGNEEFYLHAESEVKDQQQTELTYGDVDFTCTVRATVTEPLPGGICSFRNDTFDGPGSVSVTRDADGALTLVDDVVTGEYFAPTADAGRTATWMEVGITPAAGSGGSVEIYTRTFADNVWSEWAPLSAGGVPASQEGSRLDCKLVLRAEESLTPFDGPTWTPDGEGYRLEFATLDNLSLEGGRLQLLDPNREGFACTQAIELKDPRLIADMGRVQFDSSEVSDGAVVQIRTISADTAEGPWYDAPYAEPLIDTLDGAVRSKTKRWIKLAVVMAQAEAQTAPAISGLSYTPVFYDLVRSAPRIAAVTGSYSLEPATRTEIVQVSRSLSVLGDSNVHQVTQEKARELFAPDQIPGGAAVTYSVVTNHPQVQATTAEDGEKPVLAKTLVPISLSRPASADVVVQEADGRLFAEISPVPQQGAPLVICDALTGQFGPLRQVHFTDADGKPSLTASQIFEEGGNLFTLPYLDIDGVPTVEVDWKRQGQWQPLAGATLCNHRLWLPVKVPAGTPVRVAYQLKRSYVVDYHYAPERDSARVELHGAVPLVRQSSTEIFGWSMGAAGTAATAVAADPGSPDSWSAFGDPIWDLTADTAATNTATAALSGRFAGVDLADCTVTCQFEVPGEQPADGAVGLCFRLQDEGDFYFMLWDGAGMAQPQLTIGKLAGGVRTDLAAAGLPGWLPGVQHTLRVAAVGSGIRASVDDLPLLEATDTTFVRGAAGILAAGQAGAAFQGLTLLNAESATVTGAFNDMVTMANNSEETAKVLADLQDRWQECIDAYRQEHGVAELLVGAPQLADDSPSVTAFAGDADGRPAVKAYTTRPAPKVIRVFCETARTTAYRPVAEIDLNPLKNLCTTGFVYLTDQVPAANRLEFRFNPTEIEANGYERLSVRVLALDDQDNPVPGLPVSITEEQVERLAPTPTDSNGMVTVTLRAPTQPGDRLLEAYASPGLTAQAVVRTKLPSLSPTLALSVREQTDPPGTDQYLELGAVPVVVTALLFSQFQGPISNCPVAFRVVQGPGTLMRSPDSPGSYAAYTGLTDAAGKAQVYLARDKQGTGDFVILEARVTQDQDTFQESIIVKVKKEG